MKIVDVEIERILPGGQGLAHAEGMTLFIPLSAPGDKVRVELTRIKGRNGFGRIKEIIKPSPHRVEPPCPYFGRCGGCDFQQLKYAEQLAAKAEIIRDCLFRIARIEKVPAIEVTPSPREWQYRARANWQADPEHRWFGYFEQGTHNVCDIEYCAVLTPELEKVFKTVRRAVRDGKLDPTAREIDAVCGEDGISVSPAVADFQTRHVSRMAAGYSYRFDAKSFFQINQDLLEELVRRALPSNVFGHNLAVDLYCGVGLFTLPLARLFKQVIAVESNSGAARFAELNTSTAGLKNVQVHTARVGEWLLAHHPAPTDLVILDPPRTGAESATIQGILQLKPRWISYVSCDPATLARDLKLLMVDGYCIQNVSAIDLFPQTHHVETIAHLSLD